MFASPAASILHRSTCNCLGLKPCRAQKAFWYTFTYLSGLLHQHQTKKSSGHKRKIDPTLTCNGKRLILERTPVARDSLKLRIENATQESEKKGLEQELQLHQTLAKTGYETFYDQKLSNHGKLFRPTPNGN